MTNHMHLIMSAKEGFNLSDVLRDFKGSSTSLPGHEGFFDHFDTLVLAAPIAFIYLKVFIDLGYIII